MALNNTFSMLPRSHQDFKGSKFPFDRHYFAGYCVCKMISLGLVSAVTKSSSAQESNSSISINTEGVWGKPQKLEKACSWRLLYYNALLSQLQLWHLHNALNPLPEPVIVTKQLNNSHHSRFHIWKYKNYYLTLLAQTTNYKQADTKQNSQQRMHAYR